MTRCIASIGLLVAAACAASATVAAQGRGAEAAFPARAGKSRLTFECAADKAVWLRISNPPRGWLGDRKAEIRIGARSFAMEIDGASDSFILSDVKLPAMGLSESLLATAKGGEELVLAGKAAEQIPGPDRSFPLKGARAKIERVEKACGRQPA